MDEDPLTKTAIWTSSLLPAVRDSQIEMVRLRRVLSLLRIPVDLIVVSEKVFQEWSDTPGNILYEAAREGKVMYKAV